MDKIHFLKTLKQKINMYDKMTSNPFEQFKQKITLVWIEEPCDKRDNDSS